MRALRVNKPCAAAGCDPPEGPREPANGSRPARCCTAIFDARSPALERVGGGVPSLRRHHRAYPGDTDVTCSPLATAFRITPPGPADRETHEPLPRRVWPVRPRPRTRRTEQTRESERKGRYGLVPARSLGPRHHQSETTEEAPRVTRTAGTRLSVEHRRLPHVEPGP